MIRLTLLFRKEEKLWLSSTIQRSATERTGAVVEKDLRFRKSPARIAKW
jgi:hypothetical protein